ncbi:MAG: PilZ domain-containing protein [Burkholderiales bacterium]|nr:PilZ domain-containing protein [Burkholderiales bacterium]
MVDTRPGEDNTKPGGGRPSVLSLTIKERSALYAAYIPHLKRGGIFIPTTRSYRLGDAVFMLLTIMDDPQKVPVAGQVVWITPPNCQGNKAQGIGVQFSDDEAGKAVKRRIETLLGGLLQSTRSTHTY